MFNPDENKYDDNDEVPHTLENEALRNTRKGRMGEGMAQLLTGLHLEWVNYDFERNKWFSERSDLLTKVEMLEGKLRTYANVNTELLKRIKLLELALLEARGITSLNRPNNESEQIAVDHDIYPKNKYTPDHFKKGRQLLAQYLKEIEITENRLENRKTDRICVAEFLNNFNLKDYVQGLTKKLRKSVKKEAKTQDPQESLNIIEELSRTDNEDKSLMEKLKDSYKRMKRNKSPVSPSSILSNDSSSFDSNNYANYFLDPESLPTPVIEKRSSLEELQVDNSLEEGDISQDISGEEIDLDTLSNLSNFLDSAEMEAKDEMNDLQEIEKTVKKQLKPIHNLRGHVDLVYSVKFHPKKSLIATTSEDGMICIFDYKKDTRFDIECEKILQGHSDPVLSCVFDKTGEKLYSSDSAGKVFVWDIEESFDSLKVFSDLGGAEPIWNLDYSHVSNMLVAGMANGQCFFLKEDRDEPVASIKLNVEHPDAGLLSFSYYPLDHSKLLGIGGNQLFIYDGVKQVLLNTVRFSNLNALLTGFITSHSFCEREPVLWTGWNSRNIVVTDLRTNSICSNFVAHSGAVTALACSSDGQACLSGSTNGTIHLWDAAYNCLQEIQAHKVKAYAGVVALAFDGSDRHAASGGADDVVKLYI